MHVFLTSSHYDDEIGGLYQKNGLQENLQAVLKGEIRMLSILGDPYNYEMNNWVANGNAETFRTAGFNVVSSTLLDNRNYEETFDLVSDANFIILGGGHAPTQLAFFKKINLAKVLETFDGVVMGISAGSMNLAKIVYLQPEIEGESSVDFKRFDEGLGLCRSQILPHYQKVKDNYLDGYRLYEDITFNDSYDNEFIVLPDGSYVYVHDNVEEIYGKAWVITNGEMWQINDDEQVMLTDY